MMLPFFVAATPILFGLVTALIKKFQVRRSIVITGSIVQGALALYLVWTFAGADLPVRIAVTAPWLDYAILGSELAMAAYVAVVSAARRRALTLLLAISQAALALAGERWTGGAEVEAHLLIDQATLLMVVIIGVVGGLIIFYAGGYMRTYHEEHPEYRDRRRVFTFTILAFLGAMYGLVFSNDLRLMLMFWEMTTLASFVLIGYNDDEQSVKSAFRALNLNLVGGLSFALGIVLLAARTGSVELDGLIAAGRSGGGALIAAPIAFIAVAGLAKSAQLPFTPWLLSAMVAPTPVSALLHSSTMVKAGVFLLIRLAPAMSGTTVGYFVAFIGVLTFLAGAFAAVSRRNAKRVLALSTVSNLGLIAACAGIGTYQLAWVALFLVLFHAVAKALLFLSVGTASMGTGSLDIEDMGGLITGMPRITLCLVVGIFAMFIAPFGMLISKWAAMEAFISLDSIVSPLMIVSLAFGSATTALFWTKWLGVLIRLPDPAAPRGLMEDKVSAFELVAEYLLAALAIATCVLFPLVSKLAFEPLLLDIYGQSFGLARGNFVITGLMVVMTVAVPGLLMLISRRGRGALSPAYMSGRVSGPGLSFKGSKGATLRVETRSYYMGEIFGERVILDIGIILGILLIVVAIGTVLI
jgi:ech hydrogenase subunit A